jgi:hypothetical protein
VLEFILTLTSVKSLKVTLFLVDSEPVSVFVHCGLKNFRHPFGVRFNIFYFLKKFKLIFFVFFYLNMLML